jgi:hypothetical protein
MSDPVVMRVNQERRRVSAVGPCGGTGAITLLPNQYLLEGYADLLLGGCYSLIPYSHGDSTGPDDPPPPPSDNNGGQTRPVPVNPAELIRLAAEQDERTMAAINDMRTAAPAPAPGRIPVYANVYVDGVYVPGDPRQRYQWTQPGSLLVCWIPKPDLRFVDVLPPVNAHLMAFEGVFNPDGTPAGVHVSLMADAPGIVKFRFAGGGGENYFVYDPPPDHPLPTG